MQLYVKIQAAQCHCTTQVRAKPYGIVAENNLFSFMGGGGGMQQGGGPEDTERALQDSAVGVQSRRRKDRGPPPFPVRSCLTSLRPLFP